MNSPKANKVAVFEMPNGKRRKIRANDLPAFCKEVLDGVKSEGAEALTQCVACSPNAEGMVRLLTMLEEA
jgi:hypothetical protein